MGLLFTGPMGTGKTFVAEAFAKECGLTTIKLKNFRSKWVGASEGNLEKILNVIKAIGQVVVIIDEGDRAFGNTDGEGDGGTSSRVIARIKEFMSPVAWKSSVAGSYSSAVLTVPSASLVPPATRTFPLGSRVAV